MAIRVLPASRFTAAETAALYASPLVVFSSRFNVWVTVTAAGIRTRRWRQLFCG